MLVMTATPIPRTVAMTVFGDLETSELRERPSGRKDVTTTVVPADRPAWVERVWQRVREEVDAGRQVYVVCPRIGEGEEVDLMELGESEVPEGAPKSASVLATLAELSANQLQGLRLGLMHGRLAADEKARVMADFAAGQVDVLVSTTVIEVGVNVPNASVMVVLDADRFGVSQLHQLRGRIGRGGHEGVCLLLTSMPEEHPSRTRLNEVAATNDGFALAFADLEQRREGDVLGAAQSGRKSALKLLSLLRDEDLILLAREEAREVIAADPTLAAHRELEMLLWDMFDSENADYLNKT
jgi:ATP-dependent DNA helicase RecG